MPDILSIAVTIGEHFLEERQRQFAQSPFASLIRNDWPTAFSALFPAVKFPHIKAKASAGQGQWSEAPFMAFLHEDITSTPQAGYYPVILFERGFQSFCLVLAQGSHSLTEMFGAKKTSVILKSRAPTLRNAAPEWMRLGFSTGPFHTYSRGNTSLDTVADDPWASSIAFGKRYMVEAPPSLEEFKSDLNSMLELYQEVVRRIGRLFLEEEHAAEQLATSGELPRAAGLDGALKVAYHKTVEWKHRNTKLVKQVKAELGCTCQGCGVTLSSTYGRIGANFIEAHHLTPLAQAPEQGVELTANDFAVLCPTCHRIIHRLGCPSLDDLRHIVNPKVRAFYKDLIQQAG
jgi:5-methylcytosine-specific restriction protein A